MKLGKKILSFVIILAITLAMVPMTSFEALAEDTAPAPANYYLTLTVDNGVGKAYKNYVSSDNAIDLPAGLSYANGVWTMNGFNFESAYSTGVYFCDYSETKLNLVGTNNVKVTYGNDYSSYGIYSNSSLTISGTGTLNILAGGSEQSYGYCAYDIYSCGNITVNGGTINAKVDNSKYGYCVYCYYNLTMNGGKLNATVEENVYSWNYGLYISSYLKVNGGELNACGNSNSYSCGAYACYITVPFKGTTNFAGTYMLDFYYLDGEGLDKSAKSDYMSYSGLYSEEIMEQYGIRPAINVKGYYNNNWIKTTYSDQGYNLATSGLDNAKVVSNAEFVYGGHYVLLSYKVTAKEAISNGKIGIWTDVQIGDNDYAPINVVKDEDTGNVVGFELIDNHESCSNTNAKYMCYFDGYMISSAIDNADFTPAATYWFGNYGGADDHVFDNIAGNECWGYIKDEVTGAVTGLTGIDSGMAVSWLVNLEAGESETYYALLGIGDATFKEKPKFTEETIPSVTEDGKVTAVIENKVGNIEDAGNLTLSVITNAGKELTVGDAPLLDLVGGQTEAPFRLTATYTDRQINARPGNYSVKTVRATNKGGMFTDYTFKDEDMPSTEVSLVPRKTGLDLRDTQPGFESLLYEGWEWDKDNNSLYFFGLDQESDEGIQLPGSVSAIVEKEGVKINVTEAGKPAIKSAGSITLKNKTEGEGNVVIDAPVGIVADGNVTINTSMELNASETAIQVGTNGTLNIEDGATLVINLTDDNAVMFKSGDNIGIRVNVPEGYTVEGGTIDNNGFLTLDPGVKTLKFLDLRELIVTFDYNGHGPVDVATASVAKRGYLERPEDPKAFGWSFQGWVNEAGEIWNFLTGAVEKKMTLTAKWVKTNTIQRSTSSKTINTGVAALKASTVLNPEVQKEKEIVDELMANEVASTVPTSLRAAISDDLYDEIADGMEDGGNLIVGLNVDLIGCEAVEETKTTTTVTISYDVHPWYQIKTSEEDEGDRVPISNEELNGKSIAFRLPLTAIAADFEYVKLRHYLESGDEDLMYLPICTFTDGGKTQYFVNVTATQFSVFEMTFTNEKDEEEHITPREGEEVPNWWQFTDKGWMLHDGNWYNIQNNQLVKGWYFEEEDNNWYYMDPETGAMETGWVNLHGNWFYFNPENSKQTWFKDENGDFHFGGDDSEKPLGALFTNCITPDGYKVDETGAWVAFEEL